MSYAIKNAHAVAAERLKTASATRSSEGIKMSDEIETIESNPKSWGAWKREAERLQKIIDDAANREAQPVAYLKKSIIDSERFDSADPEIILHPNTPEGWHSEYQAVFTTPSAPAVPETQHSSVIAEQLANVLSGMEVTGHQMAVLGCAVDRLNKVAEILQRKPTALIDPGSLDYQSAKELFNYLMNEEETNATVNGWNACRAAMLAQPVSRGDNWKLVPVEPTAEMINAALASGAISIRTAYSAMLAAAPEGGNG